MLQHLDDQALCNGDITSSIEVGRTVQSSW